MTDPSSVPFIEPYMVHFKLLPTSAAKESWIWVWWPILLHACSYRSAACTWSPDSSSESCLLRSWHTADMHCTYSCSTANVWLKSFTRAIVCVQADVGELTSFYGSLMRQVLNAVCLSVACRVNAGTPLLSATAPHLLISLSQHQHSLSFWLLGWTASRVHSCTFLCAAA